MAAVTTLLSEGDEDSTLDPKVEAIREDLTFIAMTCETGGMQDAVIQRVIQEGLDERAAVVSYLEHHFPDPESLTFERFQLALANVLAGRQHD